MSVQKRLVSDDTHWISVVTQDVGDTISGAEYCVGSPLQKTSDQHGLFPEGRDLAEYCECLPLEKEVHGKMRLRLKVA
jgi:hypothetical protein